MISSWHGNEHVMYLCTWTYACICMNIHGYMYIYIHVYMYTYMYTYLHTYKWVYIYIHIYREHLLYAECRRAWQRLVCWSPVYGETYLSRTHFYFPDSFPCHELISMSQLTATLRAHFYFTNSFLCHELMPMSRTSIYVTECRRAWQRLFNSSHV